MYLGDPNIKHNRYERITMIETSVDWAYEQDRKEGVNAKDIPEAILEIVRRQLQASEICWK